MAEELAIIWELLYDEILSSWERIWSFSKKKKKKNIKVVLYTWKLEGMPNFLSIENARWPNSRQTKWVSVGNATYIDGKRHICLDDLQNVVQSTSVFMIFYNLSSAVLCTYHIYHVEELVSHVSGAWEIFPMLKYATTK